MGCFDTAFHASIPAAAADLRPAARVAQRWDLRRFGFHGLSHAYASARAAELTGQAVEAMRIVTCHLGAGASLAAVAGGRSVDTTMGFTPLEGLVMATRSGSVDPGLLLWLIDHAGVPSSELQDALEHRSGLLGLTGTAEMPDALEAEDAVDATLSWAWPSTSTGYAPESRRWRPRWTGSTRWSSPAASESTPQLRARAADGLGFLGIAVDPDRNAAPQLDAEIGSADALVRVLAIRAREDIEIARGVAARWAAGTAPDEHPRLDRGLWRMRARMGAHGGPAPPGAAGRPPGDDAQLQGRDDVAGIPGAVVVDAPSAEPALLVIAFRLAFLDDVELLHAVFRHECLIHTPLFAGFSGFRSKLWLGDDDTRIYRGVYQWEGAAEAAAYAGRMVGLLAPFSTRGTARHHVVPGLPRAEYLRDPDLTSGGELDAWWRLAHPAASF